ncbi:MAG: type II toxin-antitoxin system HicB family antitoxin [Treponema sp.]|nr:type II toxin-antitoxin system HicB family antitoxin [Treponema sp.]
MSSVYPVVFTETNEKENPILVYIPDINGMTEGKDIADAIAMAKDYICNALFDKTNSEMPKPKRIDEIDLKESPFFDAGKSFASLVDVDLEAFRLREKSKCVRRNITLPQWLDDMAAAARLNVSAITQNALKKELGIA